MDQEASLAGELVEVVDLDGNVIDIVPRSQMRAQSLRHRCTYVAVVTTQDELVVHQRAGWKDVSPSFWDIGFGGVADVGETWDDAARRELAEEAGLSGDAMECLGAIGYEHSGNRVVGRAYLVVTDELPRCVDGEVVAVEKVPLNTLDNWLEGRNICPDSLAAFLPVLRAALAKRSKKD